MPTNEMDFAGNLTYPNECIDDIHCNPYISNRLCYADATWLSDSESECQCNHFYGWEGENCDQYGTGTILSVLLYAAFGIASLVLFFLGAWRLHERSRGAPNTRFVPLNAANTTLMFVVSGFLGSVLCALFTILNFLDLKGTPADFFVTNTDGFARYEYATRNVAQPLLGLSCTLSQLNVCLMWLDLAGASKQLRPSTRQNLGRSRKIVIVFEGLLLFSLILALVAQSITGFPVLSLLSIPFTMVAIVLYVLGGRQMHDLMTTMMRSSEGKYKQLQRSIRKTTIAIIITDVVFLGAQIGYAVMGFDKKLLRDMSPPGTVLTIEKVCHHLIFVGFSMSNFILWRYLSRAGAGKKNVGTETKAGTADSFERAFSEDMRLGSGTRYFRSSFNETNETKSPYSKRESPNPMFGKGSIDQGVVSGTDKSEDYYSPPIRFEDIDSLM